MGRGIRRGPLQSTKVPICLIRESILYRSECALLNNYYAFENYSRSPREIPNLTIRREYKTFFFMFFKYTSVIITTSLHGMLYYSSVILLCYNRYY